MSNETMTGPDHRTARAPRTAALALSFAGGAYLLPALSYYSPLLRAALGVETQTRDRLGYGLTFDDGPHARGTPAVLEVLAAHDVHATFFLVGEQVARNPGLAGEIVAAGHGVGLHCDRHRNLMRLGPRAVAEDISRAQARIEAATGRPVELYRPPYGIFNAAAIKVVRNRGWRALLWTRWGRDWEARATPESIAELLVGGQVSEGSILLLHDADDYSARDSWQRTVAALPRILDSLAARGLPSTLEL